jgi:hypothetical protein
MPRSQAAVCEWVGLDEALSAFIRTEVTQSQRHIKPLDWYFACRLVIEGGFHPDDVVPRPPFRVDVTERPRRYRLTYDESLAGSGEQVILGGLKTKQVDVVVSKPTIGPCVAVSTKGTRNAFRNFTNRMEEAVGDCTNLHLAYPSLVLGFLTLLSANRRGPVPKSATHFLQDDGDGNVKRADTAIDETGRPVSMITRYHDALCGLTNREGFRDSPTKYEAVGLVLVAPDDDEIGQMFPAYPEPGNPLLFEHFFRRIVDAYDERFVYFAPDLTGITRRLEWAPSSPALNDRRMQSFQPRLFE